MSWPYVDAMFITGVQCQFCEIVVRVRGHGEYFGTGALKTLSSRLRLAPELLTVSVANQDEDLKDGIACLVLVHGPLPE